MECWTSSSWTLSSDKTRKSLKTDMPILIPHRPLTRSQSAMNRATLFPRLIYCRLMVVLWVCRSFDGPTSPPPGNTTNMTQFFRCHRAWWTAIQDDPRFPPVQRALRDMGFVANYSSPTWLYDEMILNSKSWADWTQGLLDPMPGRGMNRAIWDAVDVARHSRYYQVGFGDALQQNFPNALLANDDLFQHSPEYYRAGFWNSGHVLRVGRGAVGIGAQSPQLYFETAGPWTCRPTDGAQPDSNCPPNGQSPGIDQAVNITAGVPYGAFKRSGFNMMLLQCQAVRAMTLANPTAPVRPWLDYKSYGSRQSLPAGPTPHYQERQLHLFLSGVSTFYYFNPWSGLVGGTRATAADHALVSALLTELDDVIGCAGERAWIQDPNLGRWRDSFFLTGMTLGKTNTVVSQRDIFSQPFHAFCRLFHAVPFSVCLRVGPLGAPNGLMHCSGG